MNDEKRSGLEFEPGVTPGFGIKLYSTHINFMFKYDTNNLHSDLVNQI